MQNRKRDTDIQTDFWTLWEKARVGCSERIALKQVYYQGWNTLGDHQPRLDAWDKCSGLVHWEDPEGLDGEQGLGWGRHVNPWMIDVNVWQKPLQYCKVISLQLIKINEKKKRNQVFSITGACLKITSTMATWMSEPQLFHLRFKCTPLFNGQSRYTMHVWWATKQATLVKKVWVNHAHARMISPYFNMCTFSHYFPFDYKSFNRSKYMSLKTRVNVACPVSKSCPPVLVLLYTC